MSAGVRVFSSESRIEVVDVAHGASVVFKGQLSGDSQESRSLEEVLGVVDGFLIVNGLDLLDAFVGFRQDGGDLEHFSSTFTIRGGDNRSVDIQKALALEKDVSSLGKRVSDSDHGRDVLGSGSQVSDFSQIFQSVTLLGHGIGLGFKDGSDNLDVVVFSIIDLDFDGLALSGTLDESSLDSERSTSGVLADFFEVGHGLVDDNLINAITWISERNYL